MIRVSFFDAKPYDKDFFSKENRRYGYEIVFHEEKLNRKTAVFARGADAVCAFVNDEITGEVIDTLCEMNVRILAMRCAGYNNVDINAAKGRLTVVRVPAYSPYAVAEHAMGMLLTLNRKLHKAYIRTRDFNFSLVGLTGMDLHGKTAGVVGTGKIGRCFIEICRGFGMRVLAYDPYPDASAGVEYVSFQDILRESHVISLHCPLTKENYHLIDREAVAAMRRGAYLLNTSRGALVDSSALLEGILSGHIRGAGLDVYEEEGDMFYEDNSEKVIQDEVLSRFLTLPNVLVTSHQAFLTEEALEGIARTTLENLNAFFSEGRVENEVAV